MNRMIANLLYLIVLLFSLPVTAVEPSLVRMATTTSTDNSGLFEVIQPVFEKELDIRVHVIAVGTGKALELGRRGDVDMVLVHAKPAEEAFIRAGYGVKRHEIMYNDFVIVGPVDDPAGVRGLHNAGTALGKIAAAQATFISRGDDSGTHRKENAIWTQANIRPVGEWYRQVGQGMGKTLQIANEMDAYTMTDRGTWLAYESRLEIELLFDDDRPLFNPYGIIAVNPARHPDVNYAGAKKLIQWLTSPTVQKSIGEFRIKGKALFVPSAGSSS